LRFSLSAAAFLRFRANRKIASLTP